jgi:hypothetical protein
MNRVRFCLSLLVGSLWLIGATYSQSKPTISISSDHVKLGDSLIVTGNGFTPNKSVLSHLRRPDGSEYNPLRFYTNAKGEYSHKIDTVMMHEGTFEVWAEDEPAHTISNRVQFKVE